MGGHVKLNFTVFTGSELLHSLFSWFIICPADMDVHRVWILGNCFSPLNYLFSLEH